MNSSQPYFLQDNTYDNTQRAYQVKTTTSPTDGKTTIVLSDGAVNPYWGVGKEATREEINKKRDEVLAKTFRKGFEWQPVSQVSPNGELFIRMRLNDTSINTNVRPMNGEDSYGTSIVGRGVYPNGVPYSSHYDEWDLGFTGIPGINLGNTLYIYNRKSDE